jgi:glutamate/tyrosine decarboxylase-like PLP-dependent enzyme
MNCKREYSEWYQEALTDKSLKSKWRQMLHHIQEGFPSPWRENEKDKSFENSFINTIAAANRLKHNRFHEGQSALKSYLGSPDLPDYSHCKAARLKQEYTPHEQVLEKMIHFFVGMPNWGHPMTMCNVNPPGNIASIIGGSIAQLFNPDIIEGEYSWNVAKAEIESGAMLAEMVGWDPETAGGVYTFGGTGSYLYALKLALSVVLGVNSRYTGIREDAQLLVSSSGHYAKSTCIDWVGLGLNNLRHIPVDKNNCMDIASLEIEMERCHQEDKPIAMIVCTAGTTDAFAIDSMAAVRELIDRYQNAKGYPKPFLYADAVIGWSWLAFKNYSFEENPLQFSPEGLEVIKSNFTQVSTLRLVDAMGIDFHKTGWAPFNSSFFLVKDYERFTSLMARELPPYLQFSTPYNPFVFTLETSRGASGALAGWASLRFFGYEGYQVMLGRIVEVMRFFRLLLEKDRNIICVNSGNYGFVTLIRVYPIDVDSSPQYQLELTDPDSLPALRAYNELQKRIADKLFAMLHDPKARVPGWETPPYTSFTQGYRSTHYAPTTTSSSDLIHAIKIYLMSPFSNEISMLIVRNYILKVRDLVIEEHLERLAHAVTDSPEALVEAELSKWWGRKTTVNEDALAATFGKVPLNKKPLLFYLSSEQLNGLLAQSEIREIAAGEIIFSEGDVAKEVFAILKGRVRIYRQIKNNEIELATLHEGEIFGEMALFEGGIHSASVSTLEPCQLIIIPGESFIKQLF